MSPEPPPSSPRMGHVLFLTAPLQVLDMVIRTIAVLVVDVWLTFGWLAEESPRHLSVNVKRCTRTRSFVCPARHVAIRSLGQAQRLPRFCILPRGYTTYPAEATDLVAVRCARGGFPYLCITHVHGVGLYQNVMLKSIGSICYTISFQGLGAGAGDPFISASSFPVTARIPAS